MSSGAEGHVKGMLRGMTVLGLSRDDFWKSHDLEMGGHRVYVELRRPDRDEVFGSAVLYHPVHGKWVCLMKPNREGFGEPHEKPKPIFTAEQIRDMLRRQPSRLAILHELFGIPR